MNEPNVLAPQDDEYSTRALAALESEAPSSMDLTEKALFEYTSNSMLAADMMQQGTMAMQKKVLENFDDYTPTEQLTAYQIEVTAANERTGKLLTPLAGMITAKQQALIQANQANQKAGNVNIAIGNVGTAKDEAMADAVGPKVVKGSYDAYQLMQALAAAQKQAPSS